MTISQNLIAQGNTNYKDMITVSNVPPGFAPQITGNTIGPGSPERRIVVTLMPLGLAHSGNTVTSRVYTKQASEEAVLVVLVQGSSEVGQNRTFY